MTSRQRGWILGTLFVGAAWLAVFGDKTSSQMISQPVARATSALANAAATMPTRPLAPAKSARALPPLLALSQRETLIVPGPATQVDLFSPRNWAPPPPPMMAVSAPAPTAPPLPYIYAGKKLEAGRWEVYLMRGETNYIVRQGASLDDTYLVERIDPPTMTLIYRPLNQQQTLNINE